MVVRIVHTTKMIYLKVFIDFLYFIMNIYIVQILQYILSTEMMFVVIYILKKFLNERKKNNQSFTMFIIFRVKQSVGETEKISESQSF